MQTVGLNKGAAGYHAGMNCSFNGILIRNIRSRTIIPTNHGTTLYSFHTPDLLPQLEPALQLHARALVILGKETVEGTIVHYTANVNSGYEVTVEARSKLS